MTKTEQAAFKQKILVELDKVRADILDLEEQTKPIAPENAIGRVSRMDAINNKSVREAALRRSRAKRSKLEKALTKVDNPNFGHCIRCKRAINTARLMFLPESDRCIRCAR